MKRFLCLALVIPRLGFGSVIVGRIDTSVNNAPTSYSAAAGSRILNTVGPLRIEGFLIHNGTSTEIAVVCTRTNEGSTVPADSRIHGIVPANNGIGVDGAKLDSSALSSNCYIRSLGAAITSGVVSILIKGD